MIIGDDPNPRTVERHVSLSGIEFRVQRLTFELSKSQVWSRAVGLFVPLFFLAMVLWRYGFLGLLGALLAPFIGVAGWLIYGLIIAPAQAARAPLDVVKLDRQGLAWGGVQWLWANVASIEVAPYPFVSRSHVYCVEVRDAEGDVLRVAPGASQEDLAALATEMTTHRARRIPEANIDIDSLHELDALIGRGRSES